MKRKGMTLQELIIAILVLLALLLLFLIGSRACRNMKEHASGINPCRENCIQYEKALLKYQVCKNLEPESLIDPKKVLIHDGLNPAEFKCPKGGTYTFKEKIPPLGESLVECSLPEHKTKKLTDH